MSAELLAGVRAACDEHGALLILDEIQTGMGRTGTLWAYEQSGVTPDVDHGRQGLGGGWRSGAMIARRTARTRSRPATTARRSPAARWLRRGQRGARRDRRRGLPGHVRATRRAAGRGLRELPGVVSVRGRGLMLAAET
jgi:acetylornithine/succinyldiaminopimelate/putrescine aminotransferase